MKKTVGTLKKLSADERARLLYESIEKARMDELARFHDALTEGEAKGVATVAKNLLKRNMPINEIMEATGLSLEEVEALRQ